jgi:hypothetical protein
MAAELLREVLKLTHLVRFRANSGSHERHIKTHFTQWGRQRDCFVHLSLARDPMIEEWEHWELLPTTSVIVRSEPDVPGASLGA